MCARDIVCVELYSHTQPPATNHKYIAGVLSHNQKQSDPPPLFRMPVGKPLGEGGGGEGRGVVVENTDPK